jgi:hypothetical protein
MKRSLVILFLLALIRSQAQTDTTQVEIIQPPDSTEIGIPDGTPVNAEIGPAGGSIKSDDQRIELIFPAGALTHSLTITIQPTTNPAPNGTGKAYQFGPSGTQFKKPVQLIFHYSDAEKKECPADLMALAMQDESGKWEFMEYEDSDSISNTLKTSIEHFSGASNVKMLALHPEKSIIGTGETMKLKLFEMLEKMKGKKGKKGTDHTWGKLGIDQRADNWKVNEIIYGDDQVGNIYDDKDVMLKGKANSYTHSPVRLYRAPYFLPSQNPVTISVQIGRPRPDGTLELQTIVSCQVEIYDEYKILVRDTMSVWEGRGQYIADSGTFVVRVTKDAVLVKDVRNYDPFYFTKPVKKFPCVMDVNLLGCPGTVEIGAPSHLQKDGKHPANIILIFNTRRLIKAFKFSERCPGVKTPWEYNEVEPIPNMFQFSANGLYQKIPVDSRRITTYTIYVIPLRPE